MEHLDEDTLTFLALGEQAASEGEDQHLAQCPLCRREFAALKRVVAAGRAGAGQPSLERPSEDVWSRVSAELATGNDPADAALQPRPKTHHQPMDKGRPAVVPTRYWRRRTAWIAAAALLVGIATGVVGDRVLSPDEPEAPVLATAPLEPQPDWSEVDGGSATLHEVDGRPVLTVDLAVDTTAGFREVWLIDTQLERLVSLGVMVGDEGAFDVPDGLDLEEFAIVDVSDEPYDGDPAHSGDSIVRGELS